MRVDLDIYATMQINSSLNRITLQNVQGPGNGDYGMGTLAM